MVSGTVLRKGSTEMAGYRMKGTGTISFMAGCFMMDGIRQERMNIPNLIRAGCGWEVPQHQDRQNKGKMNETGMCDLNAHIPVFHP